MTVPGGSEAEAIRAELQVICEAVPVGFRLDGFWRIASALDVLAGRVEDER